jgi:aryl-alcohol dehydrogenase-like predicted oxidoreductase
MEYRRLGRTGHESSVAILGGAACWGANEKEAGAWLHQALERGINHLDIAPQYGAAESVVGPHIPAVRDRLFVGEKSLRANGEGLEAQFGDTLRLLGCDYLDLYQAHAVTTLEELDRRAPALERILALKERGDVRFAGITGHGLEVPVVMLEALARYDLDSVMFPVYPRLFAIPQYREAAARLIALCQERDLGVMAIKALARRPWAEGTSEDEHWATSWYEPAREEGDVARGVRFALSVPGVQAFCTPGDIRLLPAVLDAVDGFVPMDEAEREVAIDSMSDESIIFPVAN